MQRILIAFMIMVMKRLFILILCFTMHAGLAQAVTDPGVVKIYEHAVQKLSVKYQHELKKAAGQHSQTMGIAIFTKYKIDTLNKNEAIKQSKTRVYLSDPNDKSKGKKAIEDTPEQNTYLPIPCGAMLKGDTLILAVPPAFNPYVIHKLVKNKVTGSYEEYQKRDTIFRLNLSQPKTEKLSVPVKTLACKLSTSKFKTGDLIYGEIEFETSSYYVDDPGFKSNHIHKRLHCKYVFKAPIVDLNNPSK